MDFLLECSERVQEAVFFSVANLLNSEVDIIFFDYPANVSGGGLSDERALAFV
jgi:hypothetical protein